jgi:hypothetical protein
MWWDIKAAARRWKLRVEMRPFMASVAVIFSVNFFTSTIWFSKISIA